jgi:site-specific recombinase XerC
MRDESGHGRTAHALRCSDISILRSVCMFIVQSNKTRRDSANRSRPPKSPNLQQSFPKLSIGHSHSHWVGTRYVFA